MTQEYEFFKDFAGVTKADLEMFKCGGKKMKAKKAQTGALMDSIETAEARKTKKRQEEIRALKEKKGITTLERQRAYDKSKVNYEKKHPTKDNESTPPDNSPQGVNSKKAKIENQLLDTGYRALEFLKKTAKKLK